MRTSTFRDPGPGVWNPQKREEVSRAFDVVERLSDPHAGPGVRQLVGSFGLLTSADGPPYVLARIKTVSQNSASQWQYAWTPLVENPDGTKSEWTDFPSGSAGQWPAFEDNNNYVPPGTNVWMRPGRGEWWEFSWEASSSPSTAIGPTVNVVTNVCNSGPSLKVEYTPITLPVGTLVGLPFCVTAPTNCCQLAASGPAVQISCCPAGTLVPSTLCVTISQVSGTAPFLDGLQFPLYWNQLAGLTGAGWSGSYTIPRTTTCPLYRTVGVSLLCENGQWVVNITVQVSSISSAPSDIEMSLCATGTPTVTCGTSLTATYAQPYPTTVLGSNWLTGGEGCVNHKPWSNDTTLSKFTHALTSGCIGQWTAIPNPFGSGLSAFLPYQPDFAVSLSFAAGACPGGVPLGGTGVSAVGLGQGGDFLTLDNNQTTQSPFLTVSAKTMLVVNVGLGSVSDFPTTVTFNEQALTKAVSSVSASPYPIGASIWYLYLANAQTGQVQITYTSQDTSVAYSVVAVSGLTSNLLDVTASNSGTAHTPIVPGYTNTASPEYAQALVFYVSDNGATTFAAPYSGGGQDASAILSGHSLLLSEGFALLNSVGAQSSSTMTGSASAQYVGLAATFK